MSKNKSWTEKLEARDKDLPKIVKLDEKMQKKYRGAKTMVVPHPRDVLDIISRVPAGALITTEEIRQMLAKKYDVDIACPMTTGIFVTIAVNAAQEIAENTGKIIPWWRTLRSKGVLNEKAPGGLDNHKKMLEQEGFSIIKKGNKYIVENYRNFVVPVV